MFNRKKSLSTRRVNTARTIRLEQLTSRNLMAADLGVEFCTSETVVREDTQPAQVAQQRTAPKDSVSPNSALSGIGTDQTSEDSPQGNLPWQPWGNGLPNTTTLFGAGTNSSVDATEPFENGWSHWTGYTVNEASFMASLANGIEEPIPDTDSQWIMPEVSWTTSMWIFDGIDDEAYPDDVRIYEFGDDSETILLLTWKAYDASGVEDPVYHGVFRTILDNGEIWDNASSDVFAFDGHAGDDIFINHTRFISSATGGDGDDYLQGGSNLDYLSGMDGDDELIGGGGRDSLFGGEGDDIVYGGDGRDSIFGGWGDDWLSGGNDDDDIWGGVGDDYIFGEAGEDRLYAFTPSGTDAEYAFSGNDHLYGGPDNDIVMGGVGNDLIDGGGGDDVLLGREGNDEIHGRLGNDWMDGGVGSDSLYGNSGNDQLFGRHGYDHLFGGDDDDILDGGDDMLTDVLHGNGGADIFVWHRHGFGGNDPDAFFGVLGADGDEIENDWFRSNYGRETPNYQSPDRPAVL